MKARYFDAHCHVQFDAYDADREAVVEAMLSKGIAGIVVGCDAETSKNAVELAEKHEHLAAAVGLHPNRAGEEAFDETQYRAWLENPKVLAVGECGLDYFRPKEVTDDVKRIQKELFRSHVELAARTDKPLIIHGRPSKGTMDAYEDIIEIVTAAKTVHGDKVRGDIHFFVGGGKEAKAFFELGFTVSYTAVITFARDYDEVIRQAPLDRLLSETDSPYLAPASRRGTRNDPLAVIDVVEKVASIRSEDPETARKALLENALRVFKPTDIEPI